MAYPLQHQATTQLAGLPATGTTGDQPAGHVSTSYATMSTGSHFTSGVVTGGLLTWCPNTILGRAPVMRSTWTFLTNHAHVLLSLAANPDATLREVAEQAGITERAAHRIVSEVEGEGTLRRWREGRRNHYEIQECFPLRHPPEQHCHVGQPVAMVATRESDVE